MIVLFSSNLISAVRRQRQLHPSCHYVVRGISKKYRQNAVTRGKSNKVDDEEEGKEEEERKGYQKRESRRRRERKDSVSEEMIRDRKRHFDRLSQVEAEENVLQQVRQLGLGRKKKATDILKYRQSPNDPEAPPSDIGAFGFANYVASISHAGGSSGDNWPVFKHMLPEVAFAGHSNCGKSSLVNAVSGLAPQRGVARVSDRAGWTDAIYFYQLGKKPPLLTMVDLPGYGHAVASIEQKRRWKKMIRSYLMQRNVLSLCCVLVDAVRGLCEEDQTLLRFLYKRDIAFKIVLTKGDLLEEEELAQSHAIVVQDIREMGLLHEKGKGGEKEINNNSFSPLRDVLMVSASTGAGITALWRSLVDFTQQDVVDKGGIRVHKNALR